MTECPKNCPKCPGKLYPYYSTKSMIIQAVCFRCGFYWSNSSVYTPGSMFETMIIRNPFLLNTITKNPKVHW